MAEQQRRPYGNSGNKPLLSSGKQRMALEMKQSQRQSVGQAR